MSRCVTENYLTRSLHDQVTRRRALSRPVNQFGQRGLESDDGFGMPLPPSYHWLVVQFGPKHDLRIFILAGRDTVSRCLSHDRTDLSHRVRLPKTRLVALPYSGTIPPSHEIGGHFCLGYPDRINHLNEIRGWPLWLTASARIPLGPKKSASDLTGFDKTKVTASLVT